LAEVALEHSEGSGGYRTDGVGPQPSGHQFTVSATSGGNTSAFGVTATWWRLWWQFLFWIYT